jgi:hypothetical protein
MRDETEHIRREILHELGFRPGSREQLEHDYGQVWDTEQLSTDFKVLGFMAPFVVVERKSDGKKGSLMFQHSPRFYFQWKED